MREELGGKKFGSLGFAFGKVEGEANAGEYPGADYLDFGRALMYVSDTRLDRDVCMYTFLRMAKIR